MNNSFVVFIVSVVVFGALFFTLDLALMYAQGLSLMFQG